MMTPVNVRGSMEAIHSRRLWSGRYIFAHFEAEASTKVLKLLGPHGLAFPGLSTDLGKIELL